MLLEMCGDRTASCRLDHQQRGYCRDKKTLHKLVLRGLVICMLNKRTLHRGFERYVVENKM
jgi:hypothetical protein